MSDPPYPILLNGVLPGGYVRMLQRVVEYRALVDPVDDSPHGSRLCTLMFRVVLVFGGPLSFTASACCEFCSFD